MKVLVRHKHLQLIWLSIYPILGLHGALDHVCVLKWYSLIRINFDSHRFKILFVFVFVFLVTFHFTMSSQFKKIVLLTFNN